MKIDDIDVDSSINSVKELLRKEKDLSPALRSALEVLLLLVALLLNRMLTGSNDRTARVWDAARGSKIALLPHEASVTSVAFSPDGEWVLTGSNDKTARVWEWWGAEVAALRGHEDSVTSVAFSPDGTKILTGSNDRTARVWSVAAGSEVAGLRRDENSITWTDPAELIRSSEAIVKRLEPLSLKEKCRFYLESGAACEQLNE